MRAHLMETELALFAGGDLSGWQRVRSAVHVGRCRECRALVEAFRADKEARESEADSLPPGLDWERLSAEMSANIHLGLAAGECVSPVPVQRVHAPGNWRVNWNWRPAVIIAGLVMVFSAAAWLNLPLNQDFDILSNAFQRVMRGEAGVAVDQGPIVAASAEGIEFVENGNGLGLSAGDDDPVAVSVSFDGAASAQYVDDDTGQVTIATVYVQ